MTSDIEKKERAAEMEWLAERFKTVNQAAFAREHSVPGGASMVTQHIKGTRPMSLEAALCYASGFGVALAEVSPRLDRFLRGAIAKMGGPKEPQAAAKTDAPPSPWPFADIDEGKVRTLAERDAGKLEAAILLSAVTLRLDVAAHEVPAETSESEHQKTENWNPIGGAQIYKFVTRRVSTRKGETPPNAGTAAIEDINQKRGVWG